MKAGANTADKNRIRKLHSQGYSAEQISALTQIRPKQVEAITKQIDAGTLKLAGSLVEYNIGDGDSGDAVPDQKTAEGRLTADLEQQNDAQAAEIEALKAQLAEKEKPKRKRRTKAEIEADKAAEEANATGESTELQPAD